MRFKSLRPSPAMVIALFALTVAAAGGAAAAVGGGSEIQGCVSRDGTIKLITAGNPSCEAVQTPISWNQQGPKGDPGTPAGASNGARAFAAVESRAPSAHLIRKPKPLAGRLIHKLSLPGAQQTDAYSTFRDGKVFVNDLFQGIPSPNNVVTLPPTPLARLALPAGRWVIVAKALGTPTVYLPELADVIGSLSCSLVAGADYDIAFVHGGTLTSTVVHRFTAPGQVELRCNGLQTEASWVKITAVRVASLKNTPFP